jgi:N-acetylmuramoyl-L-alanine amidase
VLLILGALGPLQQPRAEELPATAVFDATVMLDRQVFSVPGRTTLAGPLFALPPLVEVLGGELQPGAYGESFVLSVLQQDFVLGPDSPAVTTGEEITDLSQPAVSSITGLMVPIDLLEAVYGNQLGYGFFWDAGSRTLTIQREAARTLLVRPELVRLQGATTLAFEFSERPRYRLEQRPGEIQVDIRGDRLQNLGAPAGRDPLVESVSVESQRIRVRLAPGAAAESYVLQRPFRLVFDVFQEVAQEPDEKSEIAPPQRRAGIRTIVIDPGHGGPETGAIGPSGVVEKELTLTLARLLQRSLERRLAVRAVLTREEDEELSLQARTAVANQNKADLFISLHLNSAYGGKAQGAETYILSSEASDTAAAESAAIENRAGRSDGGGSEADPLYDLQLILWDMSQSHRLNESLQFATLVQQELNRALELRDRGVKQAPFQVLMGAAMPAALVELGFISNAGEEARLQDPAYRSELVAALVRAVVRYKSLVEKSDLEETSPGAAGGREARP